MKTAISQFILAAVFLVIGGAFWLANTWERRTARADEALMTLRYGEPVPEYTGLEESMRVAEGVPVLDSLLSGVREHRAAAQYWEATDVATDRDPVVVFVVANSAYRAAQRERDRQSMARRLDDVMKQYAEVLKNDPENADAAYNYEFVARLKKNVAKPRETAAALAAKGPSGPPAEGELPVGPTIHGQPGAPPKGVDMGQFKVIMPMRPDERKDQKPEDAGKSAPKIRRG